tara:strand:- start:18800 stop:19060 length:261 start_codon:yes stop_codon:yes gene_type:complete
MPFVYTITINTGGSALSKENLTNQINGFRTQFTISEEIQAGSLRVYWNGVRQVESTSFNENTVTTFTTTFTPQSGETIVVEYIPSS